MWDSFNRKYTRAEALNIARTVEKFIDVRKSQQKNRARRTQERRQKTRTFQLQTPDLVPFPAPGEKDPKNPKKFVLYRAGKQIPGKFTKKQALRRLNNESNLKQVNSLSKATGISKKQARSLIAQVKRGAEKEIKRLKKSGKLTAKEKRGLSVARSRRRAAAQLWDLIYEIASPGPKRGGKRGSKHSSKLRSGKALLQKGGRGKSRTRKRRILRRKNKNRRSKKNR